MPKRSPRPIGSPKPSTPSHASEAPEGSCINPHGTLADYLRAIHPPWCPSSTEQDATCLLQWFLWPPDTFLLTSRILSDTGMYRFPVVQAARAPWPPKDWQTRSKDAAAAWHRWITGEVADVPESIAKWVGVLRRSLSLTMRQILAWQACSHDPSPVSGSILDLCEALLEMHTVADTACCGFGLPSGFMYDNNPHGAATAYLANMLLIRTGSLSRLWRFHGIVIPKMRTPQVGMTLRSLALHLTHHRTDVEVKWRALPWVNRDENTINALVIPFPYVLRPDAFRPHPHPRFAETIGAVRYFQYSPPSSGNADPEAVFDPRSVLECIAEAEKHVRKVNLVVFPELALTNDQFRQVQELLVRDGDGRVPLLIAGVAGGAAAAPAGSTSPLPCNEVVLSTYFAGKWYDMRQSKHHRWKVDGAQIEQYQLSGALAGTQTWWEAIELPTRQVSCLAPNQWLALCPLICEDLARQEPVSEVIRGFGPTLLMAILLDGPQLKARWSARYASVLADDPGTSVLTVTSYGMAARALPPNGESFATSGDPCPVALWKDLKSGYREICLPAGDAAVVLTMSADWLKELTADGRDDSGFAASFVLHGHRAVPRPRAKIEPRREVSAPVEAPVKRGDPVDIEELSILTHLVDAIVDHRQVAVEEMCDWALGSVANKSRMRFAQGILEAIAEARQPGRGDRDPAIRPDMEYAVHCFREAMAITNADFGPPSDEPTMLLRWDSLIRTAIATMSRPAGARSAASPLDRDEVRRVHQLVGRSILWAIHMRLEFRRRQGTLTYQESQRLETIESALDAPSRVRQVVKSRRGAKAQPEAGSDAGQA